MIVGIGIDAVEINRFAQWHAKSYAQLLRVFSHDEILYCLQSISLSAERFAVRFAAREALYKALSASVASQQLELPPFLTVLRSITIYKLDIGLPILSINWQLLPHLAIPLKDVRWHIALTHTKTVAIAYVIGENSSGSTKLI